MHSDKKITKEDTWKPSELRKHIRDGGYEEDRVRRREENERKHGSGETVERRPRDPDRGDRDRGDRDRDRDRHREKDHTRDKDKQKENNPYLDTRARDKGKGGEHNPYLDRRKEGSRDRRAEWEERDKEKRRDRERVADPAKHGDERGEHRDRRHNREEKDIQDRERDRQKEKERRREREREDDHGRNNREEKENQDRERDRQREKERRRERERDNDHGRNNRDEKGNEDRERDRQKNNERRREKERDDDHRRDSDRDKRREERDRERRREERDREHRRERDRKRHEEGEETGRDGERRRDREQRDRERENLNEGERQKHESRDRERRERHADRRHSENKEEQVYKEDGQKEREDRERRHKEREHHDEKRMHDGESREQRDGHHRGDRDQRDRDKHRERRHREEADPGPTYADETSTPKPHQGPRDKTTSSKIKVGKDEESAEGQDYGDQDYEEDFEDYEEDFEEVEESGGEGEDDGEPPHSPVTSGEGEEPPPQRSEEIKAIRRAMDEENERVGTAQSRQSTNIDQDRHTRSRGTEAHDKNQSRGSQRGKFINFVAAKQREVSKQVANKQKKRSAELLRLIDLDFSTTVSLLDLPPVSEYDMYIKSFGNTNTKQAYVQCNEDNVDRDIQTEDIEMSEKWTQHPAERHGPCGDPRLSQDARDKSTSEMNIDTQRLTTFLRSASQVMVVLLEEDYAEKQSLKRLSTKAEVLSFSDGSLQFNTKLSFLNGRHVSLVHFSPVQKQTMMSVHSPTGKPDAVCLDTWTMICIWNIWEPSRPQKILVYESEVRCCCFSPGKATLVFAGTSVGSVLLWDLREHASDHYNLKVGEDEWTFRHPTFSTDAVLAAAAGHLSSVCCVEVVPSSGAGGLRPEAPLLASDEESSGLSFQLASLDVNGVLNQWVVVELPKASDAGSQTDLGLRPGGKVKLLHSSTLLAAAERTSPWDAVNTGSFQTLLLRFLPTDSNHFFIGTNMGVVNHGTSHGLKAPPKLYRSLVAGVRPTDVTSIHFSPFSPAVFLVGCGDGSIRLHAASQEEPVLEWNNATASEPVVSVQWTRTRPTVFCVLDAASNLYIWDLQKNDLEPAVTERIHADRVTAMAVFGDSGQQNTYSGVALAHESGKLEVQYFNERFTIPSAAEPETLESMINDAF